MVLTCGHPVCDYCLRGCLKPGIGITCNLCGTVTKPTSETPDEVLEEFKPHMYLMGHMAIYSNRRVLDNSNINLIPAGASSANINKRLMSNDNQDLYDTCAECKSRKSDTFCKICNYAFCNNCWRKIHNSIGNLFRDHVKTPISKIKKQLKIEKMCPIHDDIKLDLYCTGPNCNKIICYHCFTESHQGVGHDVKTMKKKVCAHFVKYMS